MKIEIEGLTPTDQQKQMLYGIMTRQMNCVYGEAGSGKTTAIRFLKKILGDRLIVLAQLILHVLSWALTLKR